MVDADFFAGVASGAVSALVASRIVFGSFLPVKVDKIMREALSDRYIRAEDALYAAIEKGAIGMALSELRADRNAAAEAYLASLRGTDAPKP